MRDQIFSRVAVAGMAAGWQRWRRAGLFLCLAGVIAGCAGDPATSGGGAGDPTASFGPGYPPGSAAWSDGARSAYRTAFSAGMQDQKEGFRFDDDRGAAAVEVEERGFYRQGYRRGYYHESNLRRLERQTGAAAAPAKNE